MHVLEPLPKKWQENRGERRIPNGHLTVTAKYSAQDPNVPSGGLSGSASQLLTENEQSDADNHLRKLGQRYGIADGYLDNWDSYHRTTDTEFRSLLGALGVNADEVGAADNTASLTLSDCLLPAVVVRSAAAPIELEVVLPASVVDASGGNDPALLADWRICCESGEQHHGRVPVLIGQPAATSLIPDECTQTALLTLNMPAQLPWGYHDLQLTINHPAEGQDLHGVTRLILTPDVCFASTDHSRCTGVAIQLYSLRSARNCGIGDFADLADLCGTLAPRGIDAIAVNPLHALFWNHPERCSPYSPSSRLFFNPIYLAVDWVARDLIADMQSTPDSLELQLRQLQQASRLSYQNIVALKDALLRQCFDIFCEHHLQQQTAIAAAFKRYCIEFEIPLELHTRFEAFTAHFDDDNAFVDWARWPAEYHDPDSDACHTLARQLDAEITYRKFLQWQCHRQLTRVKGHCSDLGMRIGLYLDLAVGLDVHGAEPWAAPDMYAPGVHIGAPPDALGPLGQDWSLAPYRPDALQLAAFEPFGQMLRSNMCHAGAIRIDHVMGLMRQYWCLPDLAEAGAPPPGSYIHYPFEELLGILALESHRCQCRVIGEDLGTVPDGVRERLEQFGILRYRVQYFEKHHCADGSTGFSTPGDYPPLSLATVSTHDLPTIAGFWRGWDIEERSRLGLITDANDVIRQHNERAAEREKLIDLLVANGCFETGASSVAEVAATDVIQALHRLHLRSPAVLVMLQLEDLLAQVEMINLPGTIDAHPNWRRRVAIELEMLERCPGFTCLFDDLASRQRHGGVGQGRSSAQS